MFGTDSDRNEVNLGTIDLPDEYGLPPDDGEFAEADGNSLADDFIALIDDGKTYLEAELAFQKSRSTFVANQAKGVVVFGLGAFAVLHMALIAMIVGAVIALAPRFGPWGATGVVTAVLAGSGLILVQLVRKRIRQIAAAFAEENA